MSQDQHSLDALRIDRAELEEGRPLAGRVMTVLAVLLLLGLGGWWFLQNRIPRVRTVAARETADAGGAQTVLNASGYVVARRQATVSSKVTGKVVEILIEEGMKVEKDQVLARLDDSNVRGSLELAEAQIASARAALGETRARLEVAQKEAARIMKLASDQVATQSNVDQGEAEVKSLMARLHLQEQEIAVAEKQLAIWRQQLEDTVIRAPFTGIAVSKNAQPGEMISPISAGGGFTRTGIGTIVDMESLEIEVDVNESYINRVRPGQPVEASLDAYPDWKIPCKVFALIPSADRQKSTVKVRVKFDGLDPRILPDMGVKVAFQGPDDGRTPAERPVVVPETAVRREGGRTFVFVLAGGRIQSRPVSVDNIRSGEARIANGLKNGERVVLEGPPDLKEGVRAQEKKL